MTFDLAAQRLSLDIETLPFLPRVSVSGRELRWDDASQSGSPPRARAREASDIGLEPRNVA